MNCQAPGMRKKLTSMILTLLIIGLVVLAVLSLSGQAGSAAGSSGTVTVTARVTSAVRVSDGGVVQSSTTVVRQVADGFVTFTVP